MQRFEYASPTTKEQAVELLGKQWGESEALAGGSDLLSLMKDFIVTPKRLVNLKEIKELDGIAFNARTGLRLGALANINEIADNAQIKKQYPTLAFAAGEVAGPQIRNVGTLGGNLCQRPRCWYYRAGFGLLPKDESGQPLVPNGDNRYHAILGNDGPALYVHPSTLAPLLISLMAKVKTFGPQGAREIALDQFYRTPKSDGERETVLLPNEIVTEVIVPPPGNVRAASYEIRHREVLDWPMAMASVALTMSGKKVSAARLTLGHVAPIPWPSDEAAKFLVGKTISEDVAAEAGKIAVARAKALSRNAYKIQL
ncbi:MAG: FAD binding domain-containing protein, partial [Blastocatellia bacterium]